MAKLVWVDIEVDIRSLKRAQKILGAHSETDAIERALDFVIAESKARRLPEIVSKTRKSIRADKSEPKQ